MIKSSLAEPLLACLRLDQSQEKLAQLQSLTTEDLDTVVDQARLYGVMPLLFSEIKNLSGQASFPQASWQDLHNSFITSAGRNLILYRELADILKALQPAGIPVILLKGVHLAKWIYPEVAL